MCGKVELLIKTRMLIQQNGLTVLHIPQRICSIFVERTCFINVTNELVRLRKKILIILLTLLSITNIINI